ncbi:Harmonin [Exaiptasia diaphana]|nr:Harmonin [Exaiptasia diaphana]
MERGFEQENLYTISKHAAEFKTKVKVLIDNEEEKIALFNALKSYHEILFLLMILHKNAGDEILSVNNLILNEATHEEVVNLLRSRRVLVLKVKSTGKVPCKILDCIRWEEVQDKENVYYHPDLLFQSPLEVRLLLRMSSIDSVPLRLSQKLSVLVQDIRSILNTPKRYPLYRDVRYLINPGDSEAFLKLIPQSPSDGIHVVRIHRTGKEEAGFSIRGGREHKVGVFVSFVQRGSPADIVGLKAGDEILSVNNLILNEATHEEVVNLLRSRRVLVLKVKSTGKVPCKILDCIRWEEVQDKENVYYHPDLLCPVKAVYSSPYSIIHLFIYSFACLFLEEEKDPQKSGLDVGNEEFSSMTPNTRKRLLFKEGFQVIESSNVMAANPTSPTSPSSLNPSNFEVLICIYNYICKHLEF